MESRRKSTYILHNERADRKRKCPQGGEIKHIVYSIVSTSCSKCSFFNFPQFQNTTCGLYTPRWTKEHVYVLTKTPKLPHTRLLAFWFLIHFTQVLAWLMEKSIFEFCMQNWHFSLVYIKKRKWDCNTNTERKWFYHTHALLATAFTFPTGWEHTAQQ